VAVKYQRNRERIDLWIESLIPDAVRSLIPRARSR